MSSNLGRQRSSWYHFVMPLSVLTVLLSLSTAPVILDSSTMMEEFATEPSVLSRNDTIGHQGSDFRLETSDVEITVSKFKHLSANETMKILKDIGTKDGYNDAALRCSKESYREPELYWYDYSSSPYHTNTPKRRLLLVQSAGFGTYAQLLDLTSPINKAYAQKWGHTLLVVQGTLVVLNHEVQTNCTPLEHRSTHNKMQLLKFGLRLRDYYDYLLILDADAMIYDYDIDLSDLMPPHAMMGANRAVPKKGVKKRATWKINAGVTLWNLHHPLTQSVADSWTDAAVGYLNGRNNNQGDQLFLYHVLKNNATMEENVFSFAKEFNYNKATVIKHVKRPHITYEIGQTALDSRSEVIATFTEEICQHFPSDCAGLDNTKYSTL